MSEESVVKENLTGPIAEQPWTCSVYTGGPFAIRAVYKATNDDAVHKCQLWRPIHWQLLDSMTIDSSSCENALCMETQENRATTVSLVIGDAEDWWYIYVQAYLQAIQADLWYHINDTFCSSGYSGDTGSLLLSTTSNYKTVIIHAELIRWADCTLDTAVSKPYICSLEVHNCASSSDESCGSPWKIFA